MSGPDDREDGDGDEPPETDTATDPRGEPAADDSDDLRSLTAESPDRAREELASFDPDDGGSAGSPDEEPVPESQLETPPEYAIEGLGGASKMPTASAIAAYRRRYGRIRTYFRARPDRFADYQRTLNQARVGDSYDAYLARAVRYALAVGLVGVLLGLALTTVALSAGVFGGISAPSAISGDATAFLAANPALFGGAALALAGGLLLGGGTYAALYYYPVATVSSRRQSLEVTLPHAIVFMYALSYGGMDLMAVIRAVADAEDTYGEVAREFDTVVRDVELFGNDPYTALRNLRNLTASDNVEQFVDDLLSVLESGGGVTAFLEDEAQGYLESAVDSQADFLETLAIMAEVFIVGFVAAPLFLVVILVVMSLVGAQTILQIQLLVYLVIPIGMLAFLVLIDTLSGPFVQRGRVDEPDRQTPAATTPAADERLRAYRRQRRVDDLRSFLGDPFRAIRQEPLLSLLLSVPAAIALLAVLIATGVATPTLAAMADAPIAQTTWLVVVPGLVATTPLAISFERRRYRDNTLARRFPDTLNVLASANKMGIGLTEGLGLVVRSSSGVVANELRKVRNDIQWNGSTSDALKAFGARVQVPQLARTTRLLAEGIRSSGDLSRVLAIAAEDARNRYRLERARTRELSSYIAIVVIGYLVYLAVVLILDVSYLTPIEAAAQEQAAATGGIDSPLDFSNVPTATYERVFYHSALIQAVGSGLLAGKLADNSVLSGLKYAIGLSVVAAIAFLFM